MNGRPLHKKGSPARRGGDNDKALDKKQEVEEQKPNDPHEKMKCFKCRKMGHPACFCPNDSDHSSMSSMSSGKSKCSLSKQFNLMKKSFARLQAALESDNGSTSSD